MNSPTIQLLVLAGIAIFLILKLKSVLGTREGFEKPPAQVSDRSASANSRPKLEVIEGGIDRDITDHVEEGSDAAKALAAMKEVEPEFSVSDFIAGARGAYEMILMAFERGDMDSIKPFLSKDVFEAFSDVVEAREKQGMTIEAKFIGLREIKLVKARFSQASKLAEITIRFIGELNSIVRDKDGNIVEGKPNEVRRQKDIWTFARTMGSEDPNWKLVATGE
ncbi:MAG TPA: Tim44 domain-containing protein [Rhodobacteraceae bacterium]|nr:Tim44 domain-containing protein [Paracoccaceae bacterium]